MDRLKKRNRIFFEVDDDVYQLLKKYNIKGKSLNLILRIGLVKFENNKKLDYIIQKLNEINLNIKEGNLNQQELLELNELLKTIEE